MIRDFAIYLIHALFWGVFVLARAAVGGRALAAPASGLAGVASHRERIAPFSRTLVAGHMFAFAVLYLGLARAVLPGRIPYWFSGQREVGTAVIAGSSVLMVSALASFRSWRLRAKLDLGHQLVTAGPFRSVRHPLYLGLNLLALGTAIFVPAVTVWIGFVLMVVGSDLRARAEESILGQEFGAAYREYCGRTRRFIPRIY